MEEGGALSLCALPKEVLRIILGKLGLKDRSLMELLDKRTSITLREPDLWYKLDLEAMQALELKEDQLLGLLNKVEPDLLQGGPTSKVTISLDASGAVNLSPDFLTSCLIALSAAGFRVDFKMDSDSDPLFPAYHLISILQPIDCSMLVNVLISGLYCEKDHFLESLKPQSAMEHRQDTILYPIQVKTLAQTIRVAKVADYSGSEAAYGRFLDKIARLAGRKLQVEASIGRPLLLDGSCVQALVVARRVVLENVTSVDDKLKNALKRFVEQSPSTVQVSFRNCLISQDEILSLCDVLEQGGAGFVSFQQCGVPFEKDCQWPLVLNSAALLKRLSLQILELDCPLSVQDLDSAATFLDGQVASAKLVLHVRISYFPHKLDLAQAKLFLLKLRELCSSEHGARIQVVVHSKASGAWGEEPLIAIPAVPGLPSDHPLDQFEQDIRGKERLEWVISCGAFLQSIYMVFSSCMFVAIFRSPHSSVYYRDVAGVTVSITNASLGPNIQGVRLFWHATEATLRGKRDWVGMLMGLFLICISMMSVLPKSYWDSFCTCT